MEMALDEKRVAEMHQKHDTVCIMNMGSESVDRDGRHRKDSSMLFLFCGLFFLAARRNQIVLE